MFDWITHQAAVIYRIAGTPSPLKILLKTKDDPFFLERWINHHATICGLSNLIIFDNMSTDEKVMEIYGRFGDDLTVIRFSGLHNNVHDTVIFDSLYIALNASTEYYCFLDTDEYLLLYENDRIQPLSGIVAALTCRESAAKVYPGTWLYNAAGLDDVFLVGTSDETLANGLRWGKPIIRANLPLQGFINHNIQLPKSVFDSPIITKFIILHLTQLSAEQRIRANINKLIARGFAVPGEDVNSILSRADQSGNDRNIKQYLAELTRISQHGFGETASLALRQGQIKISLGERVTPFSEAEMNLFARFIGEECSVARDVLELLG